jgi:hypothetical protein
MQEKFARKWIFFEGMLAAVARASELKQNSDASLECQPNQTEKRRAGVAIAAKRFRYASLPGGRAAR